MSRQPEPPSHAERGARLVGELLKVWPAKEAPLPAHIAFCEALQHAVVPYTTGNDREADWFRRLDRELASNLKTLRRLAANLTQEADRTKTRLHTVAKHAPRDLWRAVQEARQSR
jgi:hypothetical protein